MTMMTGPKNRENFWLWLTKILAGILIVILLGVHFVVNHLVAPGGLLSYADVLAYYQVHFIPIMEVLFLIVVFVHAFIGVRSIILDLNPSKHALTVVDISLVSIGTIAIIYGTWLVIVVVQAGK